MIKVKKLHENAIIPTRSKDGDAGLDLYTLEDAMIKKGETIVIPTGIAIQLPETMEATVRPRSGITLKGCPCEQAYTIQSYSEYSDDIHGVEILYKEIAVQLGTIDSNYTGDVGIIAKRDIEYSCLDVDRRSYNEDAVKIPKHTKLAQLVISPIITEDLTLVDELEETNRGNKGFGSSGIK